MSDGRPYRAECWAQDQVTCLSIMFSIQGYESATKEEIADALEIEGIARFNSPKRFIALNPLVDGSGNQLLVANVVVGDEDGTYITDNLSLLKWQESSA
jgi:hypothetical protein